MFSETSFLKISLQKVSNFPFSDQTWLEKYPIPIPERRTRNNEAVIKKVFLYLRRNAGIEILLASVFLLFYWKKYKCMLH